VTVRLAIAFACAIASTVLVNVAYIREQSAASALPPLSLRRPFESLRLLLANRRWLGGLALETGGFGLYVGALALAPLALVQSAGAGGVGLLAVLTARIAHRSMTPHEAWGAAIAVAGLLMLGGSLAGGATGGGNGETIAIIAWLGASSALTAIVLLVGRRSAASYGLAGGLAFSIGDVSTKISTQGGVRVVFALTLVAGYVLGTSLLQLGYQRGAALTVAGLATLLTNALPIVAGTVLLGEPVPGDGLGALRALAFVAVIAGAIVLAKPPRT
jgi:hypothetical protein